MKPALAVLCIAAVGVFGAIAWIFSGDRSIVGPMPPRPAGSAVPFRFTDVTNQAGFRFSYFRGETGEFWLTETTGGGVALIDYDGDDFLDIFFVNGCAQPVDGTDATHSAELIRNGQDGSFVEVTGRAGAAHFGYGQGCTVGDYDNDGFDDLYLTCAGSNVLFRNQGDGTFCKVTEEAEADCDLWSTGSAFGDFDRDGDLDLFVVNYVDFDPATAPHCGDPHTRQRSYCGPNSFNPLPNRLFENLGDGRFADVSIAAGINLPDGRARPENKGLGIQIADLDADGDLDVFVANDQQPSFLFHNDGRMRFSEVGVEQGVALTGEGATTATMGIACGDYDRDGLFDLFTTNFYLEGSTLYHNLGSAGFQDVTAVSGLASATRRVLGWGTALVDFDNDGWLDLFAANGHVQHDASGVVPYAMRAQLFHNRAGRSFAEVEGQPGSYFDKTWNGRGAAFGDIDNDGDTDIVVVHHHQPAAILRNDTQTKTPSVRVKLVGIHSDRNAIGARIVAVDSKLKDAESLVQARTVRHVNVSGSYLSSSDFRVLIAVPGTAGPDLEIHWNSGQVQRSDGRGRVRWIRERLDRVPGE